MNQKNGIFGVALLLFLVCTTFWYGCSRGGAIPTPTVTPIAPIVLTGSQQEDLASLAKDKLFPSLSTLAQNPENTLDVLVKTTEGTAKLIQLSFEKGNKVLNIARGATDEVKNLTWSVKGVKLTDKESKETTAQVEFVQFKGSLMQSIQTSGTGTEDFLKVGATATGIALAVWLGAGLAGTILSFIGFLAFLALIVGLIAVSSAFLTIAKVSKDDILNWLEGGTEKILDFFQEVGKEIQEKLQEKAH